jgi:hypothetical protein
VTKPVAATLGFALAWSTHRREHQTRARSSHYWRRWLKNNEVRL